MKNYFSFLPVLALILVNLSATAQKDSIEIVPDTAYTWHHLDLEKDGVVGVSVNEAIAFAESKNREAKPIIVAVMDSGIDTAHYDLKNRLWVNPGEIPNNGIDDDNNGYIDDVHGWNFMGNADGKNVEGDTYELTRLYSQLKEKYKRVEKSEVDSEDMEEYERWLKIKEEFEQQRAAARNSLKSQQTIYDLYKESYDHILEKLDGDEYNLENVQDIQVYEGTDLERSKNICVLFLSIEVTLEDFEEAVEHYETLVNIKLNPRLKTRHIVGDDETNPLDSIYGNNDIQASDPSHGTHVAGIIGADANNEVGTKGICPTSQLMIIRVVPGGDERDKDVAMGYRYATKMGAKVVNCSFGKLYSPYKEMVDDAVRFADQNGVLIIHAAGNDAANNDKIVHYPDKTYANAQGQANNWITVGSSTKYNTKYLLSSFSNYGEVEVDLFAPGSDILSTYPTSELEENSGTSMAAPVVSGVAALVWSYYPELSAEQLKEILLLSVIDYSNTKVIRPNEEGKKRKKKMKDLCATGGVINALTAMKLAEEYVNR